MAKRRFLLLQGPSSRFFTCLGRALQAKGATVTRIGLAPADRLFWSRDAGTYLPLRREADRGVEALARIIGETGATDLIMLGDGRAPHRAAIEAASRAGPGGPVPWIVELGYLRPDLILIEPWGTGGRSRIPALFEAGSDAKGAGTGLPRFGASFLRYASYDMACNLTNSALAWWRYPGHRHHAIDAPLREYAGWAGKLAQGPARAAARRRALARIAGHGGPQFLFPLQLSTDFQIRRDGTGQTMEGIVEDVIADFAKHAPEGAALIVKVHPLDNGLTPWAGLVDAIAKKAGVGERVAYLDGGDLPTLLAAVSGVVTVNSTLGLTAILAGLPTYVLGSAVYDRRGLSASGTLEAFWTAPEAPDAGVAAGFRQYLLTQFHVQGAFDGPGARHGASALAEWLSDPPPAARRAAEGGP